MKIRHLWHSILITLLLVSPAYKSHAQENRGEVKTKVGKVYTKEEQNARKAKRKGKVSKPADKKPTRKTTRNPRRRNH